MNLQQEIQQRTPFRTPAQEATLALMRTADVVRRRVACVIEPHGITMQQYNVLRILRGAGGKPLGTTEIAERLIEQTPGVTRLLDRLEEKGLVRRQRCRDDRRQVHTWITDGGLELLKGMDEAVDRADEEAVAALTRKQQKELNALLALIRQGK